MESPNENLQIEENSPQEEKEIETNDANKKCVFISGIPYNTTEEELKEKFQTCGVIREIKMPTYQDSGRNIGYAHIYFKKNKELNNSFIGTRYLTVAMSDGGNDSKKKRKCDEMEIPPNCKTIFVRNLPYDLTEAEIGDKFKPCGDIKSIRMVYNSFNRNFKGFCYLEFEDNESFLNAMNLNGKQIKGREMIVDFEDSGPKSGYKFRSETPSKFNKDYRDIMKKNLQKKRNRPGK